MGFLERVYENALSLECQRIGLEVQQQVPLSVKYRGETDWFQCKRGWRRPKPDLT
ncbi:MAG: GxxExxY protein [Bacteroidota bacterium]